MLKVEYKAIEYFHPNRAAEWQIGSIFCEHAWLKAIAAMGRGEVGIWQALWDDEPVVFAPVLWRKTTFGKMAFLPPLTPYWGLAFKPGIDDAKTLSVLSELVKHNTGWRIALSPDQTLPSLPFPIRIAIHTTQIILPKPKEQLKHDLTVMPPEDPLSTK